ncbi:MAG: LPS export ABC transporter ATP-binding protein [Chlamydiia bacterium]
MQPLFEARSLTKSWGGRPIVKGLSYTILPGEILGLLGPNGAGKTTAFYMTMGLVRPDSGQCFWESQEITSWSIDARARAGMGYLAQEPSVFRQLTVRENLWAVLETLPLAHEERLERLESLSLELHLETVLDQKASTLSGGQRRRVEIARALVREPRLLLLDEPFANIDPLTIQDVKQIIRYLAARGIAILITDHNAREIFEFVDRVLLMIDGKEMASGTPEELAQDPMVRSCYLGESFSYRSPSALSPI